MIKVGITGQNGFIGTHLYNYLGLKEDIELVPFHKHYFTAPDQLMTFVASCDVIVHLAAMNRHKDPEVIYQTNINLVQLLITACENAHVTPHVIFSSSSQEERDNLYGKSKREGRQQFEKWANENGSSSTGLIIPNVFGPFGKPNYNSVVATFCHKIIYGETPEIHVDAPLRLIYINELLDVFYDAIQTRPNGSLKVAHSKEIKVSEILELLTGFKIQYLEKGTFPTLNDAFHLALFNTFRCYIPKEHYPIDFTEHSDNRGSFVEIVRANTSGQYSFSTTKPGITRGNHFHTRKVERFAVIKGQAEIQLRKVGTDDIVSYIVNGESPQFIDIPIWHTHNIKNIGDSELLTLFWINEPYSPEDPDTYYLTV